MPQTDLHRLSECGSDIDVNPYSTAVEFELPPHVKAPTKQV